ncbi:hypothetical protein EAI_13202 [Harpegnathos saltator]|uniref:Uncharacterized protein n=1 Tax=Harpegnathos saltator TaxID=610380 RepID=E2B707_HARSA|nr:hypothetical protein EAI_13202 [Harpegnathos saltator]
MSTGAAREATQPDSAQSKQGRRSHAEATAGSRSSASKPDEKEAPRRRKKRKVIRPPICKSSESSATAEIGNCGEIKSYDDNLDFYRTEHATAPAPAQRPPIQGVIRGLNESLAVTNMDPKTRKEYDRLTNELILSVDARADQDPEGKGYRSLTNRIRRVGAEVREKTKPASSPTRDEERMASNDRTLDPTAPMEEVLPQREKRKSEALEAARPARTPEARPKEKKDKKSAVPPERTDKVRRVEVPKTPPPTTVIVESEDTPSPAPPFLARVSLGIGLKQSLESLRSISGNRLGIAVRKSAERLQEIESFDAVNTIPSEVSPTFQKRKRSSYQLEVDNPKPRPHADHFNYSFPCVNQQ